MFQSFVTALKDPEVGAYFQEAIDCAKNGFVRAAAVMAWCAAIDRVHRKIEQVGFSTFNVTSAQMASQQKGRFKRFNQIQNVASVRPGAGCDKRIGHRALSGTAARPPCTCHSSNNACD